MAKERTRSQTDPSESRGLLAGTGIFSLKELRLAEPAVAVDRKRLESSLRWLRHLRTAFLATTAMVVALVALSAEGRLPDTIPLLLEIAVFGFVLSLAYTLIASTDRLSLVAQAYVQFLGDLLLVTALVYTTGGALSSFSMLYLIVIAAAAAILKRRAGITIGEIAWLLYAAVVVSLYFGWPAPTGGDSPIDGAVSVGRLAYELFIHLVGFYAVAYLTSLLSNQAARAEQELATATGDLEALEVFHRDVVQSMSSGLVLVGLDERIVAINRIGRTILGLAPDFQATHLNDLDFLDSRRWQEILSLASKGRIRDEIVVERDGQEPRTVGFSVGVIRDANDQTTGHSLVFQDLTEWRRLQAELSEKERMAAVGELAAGLAHEVGNPLAAISGSVQMLQSSGETDTADSKLLNIVLKESQRLDRTIKGFLQFAKPHEKRDGPFDICNLINENLELFKNSDEVKTEHQLLADLDPKTFQLVGDRDQIAQVFWNLARNAVRAMPEGGQLRIVGRQSDEQKMEYSLRFIDSGVGMTAEQRHGLFHPFRSHQGGVGIGMAIVYRIIQSHNGKIDVESTVGQGTTIEIRLPAKRGHDKT